MTTDLSRFDPRLIEAWRKGAEQPLDLPFTERRHATTLRHQLYRIRRALEANDHPIAASAKRAQVKILTTETGWVLRIEPLGSEFNSALEAAGLNVPDIDIDF